MARPTQHSLQQYLQGLLTPIQQHTGVDFSFYLLGVTYRIYNFTAGALHMPDAGYVTRHKRFLYCLIRYFLFSVRIAKCFTGSRKRFLCEVMFKNEHTFYS